MGGFGIVINVDVELGGGVLNGSEVDVGIGVVGGFSFGNIGCFWCSDLFSGGVEVDVVVDDGFGGFGVEIVL